MRVYRASRLPRDKFDPLDASRSVVRDGWRYNDSKTEILYAAEVEALALLEVVVRPGWDTVSQITVAEIEIRDGSIVDLAELAMTLPTNWNARPAARDSRGIAREFLTKLDARPSGASPVHGLRVPSVISTTDHNVLLDPRQSSHYQVVRWARIPFDTLRTTPT
jgi:RES domain-containing protein